MESLILSVNRAGDREVLAHDVLILDDRTRAVRGEHIPLVVDVARARIRKHHDVAEREGGGVETDVARVAADREAHFVDGILQRQLEQRRRLIVGDVFGLGVVLVHLLEGIVGVELDILLQQRQLRRNDGLVADVDGKLLRNREGHLDLHLRLFGDGRIVEVLLGIIRVKLFPMALDLGVLLHLFQQRLVLIRLNHTRHEVIGLLAAERIFDADAVADILDGKLIADGAVVKGVVGGGRVVIDEVEQNLRVQLRLRCLGARGAGGGFAAAYGIRVGGIITRIGIRTVLITLIVVALCDELEHDNFAGFGIDVERIAVLDKLLLHRGDGIPVALDAFVDRGELRLHICGLEHILPNVYVLRLIGGKGVYSGEKRYQQQERQQRCRYTFELSHNELLLSATFGIVSLQ